MPIQIMSRIHVSPGKVNITASEVKIPIIGMNGNSGVLKGLCTSGFLYLKISTPAQTKTKANKVPIETNSPNRLIGNKPAISMAKKPVITVVM